MDEHSKSNQSSKQIRKRNYDDMLYVVADSPPSDLPDWTYGSDEEERQKKKRKAKGKVKESATKPKRRRITDYEESIMYSEGEKHQTGESARIGEIWGAIVTGKREEEELEGFVVSDKEEDDDDDDEEEEEEENELNN